MEDGTAAAVRDKLFCESSTVAIASHQRYMTGCSLRLIYGVKSLKIVCNVVRALSCSCVGFLTGYGPAWVSHFMIEGNKPVRLT